MKQFHGFHSVEGDPFKSSDGFSADPFASEDPFKDAFGTTVSGSKVSESNDLNLMNMLEAYHF